MKYPTRRQNKHTKKAYQVRNWRDYEQGLRDRGDLTVWFSPSALDAWKARPSRRPGGQRVYADLAIETALTVRMVYGLALRQTEGLLRSLCGLLELDLPVPDHTTLSRRARKLGKIDLGVCDCSGPIHLLVDSTGLRVHVGHRQVPKTRGWRKLHIAMDAASGEVAAVELSASGAADSGRVPRLLSQVERGVVSLSADGAYDTEPVYEAVAEHAGQQGRAMPRVLIPPRRRAQLSEKPSIAMRQRNRNIRSIRKRGRRRWHKASGYSRRSLAENTMYRYKTILGGAMRARSLAGQRFEVRLGCRILNTMTALGMPDSHRVE
jgi:hypothetical protein